MEYSESNLEFKKEKHIKSQTSLSPVWLSTAYFSEFTVNKEIYKETKLMVCYGILFWGLWIPVDMLNKYATCTHIQTLKLFSW